jgi:very-short-patch-repair endonuclease
MANGRARELRRNATDAETRLWSALRDRRLAGYKFRRQYPLDGAILDFACIAHRLAVEADGGQHDVTVEAQRTAAIRKAGWRLLRFWNNDILANTDGVVLSILAALESDPCPRRP